MFRVKKTIKPEKAVWKVILKDCVSYFLDGDKNINPPSGSGTRANSVGLCDSQLRSIYYFLGGRCEISHKYDQDVTVKMLFIRPD